MSDLFLRAAVLKVGSTVLTAKAYKGFRTTFEIDKNSEAAPNQARISLYGLDRTTREAFQNAKDLICALEVGYIGRGGKDPQLSQVFEGNVRTVRVERQGPDNITSFDCGDAEKAIQETKIEKTYAEGTSTTNVLGDLAGKLQKDGKVSLGNVVPTVIDFFKNGLTLSGPVAKQLDTVTEKIGLEWNITDNVLNFLKPAQPTNDIAVVVNKNTGLIGVPTRITNGIEFTSLLNTKIKPGVRVVFTSEKLSGQFKVRRAVYVGDTNQGTFQVRVEAIEVTPGVA